MHYIRVILGQNLLALRKQRGFTQADLASALQTTTPTYNRWESGNSWPDAESLEKLAAFYGVSSSRFFYDPSLDPSQIENPWVDRPSPKEIAKKLQGIIDELSL